MPIERYKSADPFENHPLFKTEEQARLEETMDGVDPHFVAHSADVNLALARRGDCREHDTEPGCRGTRRRDRGLRFLGRRSRSRLRLGRLKPWGQTLRV